MFQTFKEQAETMRWAVFATHLNGAVDSGRYSHITKEVILHHIEDGDVFGFLARELGNDIDLRQLTDVHRHALLQHWRRFAKAYETQQFHVTKGGLSLLVAYLLHLIQCRHVQIPT